MIKLLKSFTKKECFLILITILLVITQVYLDLKMPDYMLEITVLVQSEGSQLIEIVKNGIYMLSCAFGSLISAIIVGYLVSNISASFSMIIRKKIFSKVNAFATSEIKEFSTSSLITRTTNDVTQIEMLVAMGLQLLLKAPITAIWAITKILNKSWQWSAVTALAIIIILTTIFSVMSITLPKFKIIQKLIDKINNITRENIRGIRVVRAFNAEKYQLNKFEKVNGELTKLQLFNQRTFSILSPVMNAVMKLLTLAVYVIGTYLIKEVLIEYKLNLFGEMMVFSSYAMQVISAFLMLAMIFMMAPRAQVSINRINEVLDSKITIKDGTIDKDQTKERGTIEFRNVSFKYPDGEESVIENVSFKVNQGESVAFIGSTGSGKSTLINLVPRFYDVTEGEILVDGINIKDYKEEFLHNKLGYVSQKAILFNDTVKNNVTYGDNGKPTPSIEKIKKAIEIAQGKEFVEKMDNKYETEISQGGTNISGGQKQRISIARAIARDPEIYIFDDSFSALDYKTDAKLRKELKQYTKDSTILIVSQRVGTIMNADKIIVLDERKVKGIGTHEELLKKCKVYKELCLSQLTKEELNNA